MTAQVLQLPVWWQFVPPKSSPPGDKGEWPVAKPQDHSLGHDHSFCRFGGFEVPSRGGAATGVVVSNI